MLSNEPGNRSSPPPKTEQSGSDSHHQLLHPEQAEAILKRMVQATDQIAPEITAEDLTRVRLSLAQDCARLLGGLSLTHETNRKGCELLCSWGGDDCVTSLGKELQEFTEKPSARFGLALYLLADVARSKRNWRVYHDALEASYSSLPLAGVSQKLLQGVNYELALGYELRREYQAALGYYEKIYPEGSQPDDLTSLFRVTLAIARVALLGSRHNEAMKAFSRLAQLCDKLGTQDTAPLAVYFTKWQAFSANCTGKPEAASKILNGLTIPPSEEQREELFTQLAAQVKSGALDRRLRAELAITYRHPLG